MLPPESLRINKPEDDGESYQRYEENIERQIEKVYRYRDLWNEWDKMEGLE